MEEIQNGSYTPEPFEPHPIERESVEGPDASAVEYVAPETQHQVVPLAPEYDSGGPSTQTVGPVDRVLEPLQWPTATPLERTIEPLTFQSEQIDRSGTFQDPTSTAQEYGPGPQSPQSVDVEREHVSESPEPINWLEREPRESLSAPQVFIDAPPVSIDPARLVFRTGPRVQETYFVS